MFIEQIELVDFRNYERASFSLTAETTAIVGRNGQGKTNVAEAMAFLATLDSFRQVPVAALVRDGAESAFVRATVKHDDGRELLVEVEIPRQGRVNVLVNKQRLARTRDLVGVLRVTVFSPDDLDLVKGAPSERRRFADDALVSVAAKNDALRLELDRVIRQRNTLLRQCAGRLTEEVGFSLDVWDERLAAVGDEIGQARATLLAQLQPMVEEAYQQVAGARVAVALGYEPDWRRTGLAAALTASRRDDVRRGVSTVGPHRDDIELFLGSMPARTHASQGEMRSLALSLRLAVHRLVARTTDMTPLLVLDDVLSELDPGRCEALLAHLPPGQVVITTASPLPVAARPDRVITIEAGQVKT
ncbi:MAG: DNA replication and repair protein RecF [Acidimicrobiales bacterium mtb01]|nr:DNA replication/repair protein RecF [Actinomycetota bacterium]TEX46812.1 MAG: DNA replication and repair protein RecF [Acidimicrobiales bacterium mtb01]